MHTERFLADTEQLTRYLGARFGQRKIYLVGFSWGSFLGLQAAARHPELYHAYIGISQLVDLPTSELLLHREGIAEADRQGRPHVAAQLRSIGEPPYRSRNDERLVNKLTKDLQPHLPNEMTRVRYLTRGLASPYYSLADLLPVIQGVNFSGHALEEDVWSRDLRRAAPEIDVPVYFFVGRYDTVLSGPLAVQYLHDLRAPRGKHLVRFGNSDHVLHLEEPARFRAALHRVLMQTLRD